MSQSSQDTLNSFAADSETSLALPTTNVNLLDLPDEIILGCVSYLTPASVLSFAAVSQHCRRLALHETHEHQLLPFYLHKMVSSLNQALETNATVKDDIITCIDRVQLLRVDFEAFVNIAKLLTNKEQVRETCRIIEQLLARAANARRIEFVNFARFLSPLMRDRDDNRIKLVQLLFSVLGMASDDAETTTRVAHTSSTQQQENTALPVHLPNLRRLNAGFWIATDIQCQQANLQQLTHLRVATIIEDGMLSFMTKPRMPRLHSLTLTYLNDAEPLALHTLAPNLAKLCVERYIKMIQRAPVWTNSQGTRFSSLNSLQMSLEARNRAILEKMLSSLPQQLKRFILKIDALGGHLKSDHRSVMLPASLTQFAVGSGSPDVVLQCQLSRLEPSQKRSVTLAVSYVRSLNYGPLLEGTCTTLTLLPSTGQWNMSLLTRLTALRQLNVYVLAKEANLEILRLADRLPLSSITQHDRLFLNFTPLSLSDLPHSLETLQMVGVRITNVDTSAFSPRLQVIRLSAVVVAPNAREGMLNALKSLRRQVISGASRLMVVEMSLYDLDAQFGEYNSSFEACFKQSVLDLQRALLMPAEK